MARPQQTVFERNVPARAVVDHALGGTRHAVLWSDDLGERASYPALSAAIRADIAVVGGGYTGLWSALRAKQRHPGARVVLVEARSVGWAASGRNIGFCGANLTHGRESGRPPDVPDSAGDPDEPGEHDQLTRLGQENLAAIGATVDTLGLDCQWERTGVVELAIEPHQIDWLLDAAARAARTGAPHTFLDRAKMRAEVASPTYEAGLVRPDDAALVHPARLAAELARAASELGVEIFEQTRVTRLVQPRRGARDDVVLRTTRPRRRGERCGPTACCSGPARSRPCCGATAGTRCPATRRRSPRSHCPPTCWAPSAGAAGRASPTWRTGPTATGSRRTTG